jgi:hypothetical protein
LRSINFDTLAHNAARPDPRTRPPGPGEVAQLEPAPSVAPLAVPTATLPAPPGSTRPAQPTGK